MNVAELPDFEQMYEIIGNIRDKSVEVTKLDIKIKTLVKDAFVRGREEGLPVTHIENSYKHTGFDNEILPLREQLAEEKSELEFLENSLELYRSKIEVWRTVSANERSGVA